MYNKNQLLEQMELVTTLNILVHAYEEVSVIKMQKVRKKVLSTRLFLEDLAGIFTDVKQGYNKEILAIMKKKNQGKSHFSFSTTDKNGKTAYVLITSNARLYGDIVKKVYNLFMRMLKKNPNVDVVIIGKLGKELFDGQQQIAKKPYKYFEISDSNPQVEDLRPVVEYLMPYDKVNVYFGKFENLVTQSPAISSVSGDQPMGNETKKESTSQKFAYVFEPSLEKVLNFFEHQVFGSLFKQAIHESELARLASRAKAMESAILNIEKEENILKHESRKLKKAIENKKRLEGLAGVALWS